MSDMVWFAIINSLMIFIMGALMFIVLWKTHQNHDTVKTSLIDKLIHHSQMAHVFQNSEYEATFGGRLPYYFNASQLILCSPSLINDIVSSISSYIREYLDKYPNAKICVMEKDSGPIGVLALASSISQAIGSPISVIRPNRDIFGMDVEGAGIKEGDDVILIQDVITSGGQIIEANRVIKGHGAKIISIIVLYDREEPKKICLEQEGIKLISIFSASLVRDKIPQVKTKAA